MEHKDLPLDLVGHHFWPSIGGFRRRICMFVRHTPIEQGEPILRWKGIR